MLRYARATPLVLIILWGCTQGARERLKHFFFEVPPDTAETVAEGDVSTSPAGAAEQTAAAKPRYVSVHAPYQMNQCEACHGVDRHPLKDDALRESCSDCHERYFDEDEVTHFPVSEGCTSCHQLHHSEHPSLLVQPVLDTCVACHDGPADLSEEAHSGPGVENCVRCHDPHFGGEGLLKKERVGGLMGQLRARAVASRQSP